jgi:hypothetical protein
MIFHLIILPFASLSTSFVLFRSCRFPNTLATQTQQQFNSLSDPVLVITREEREETRSKYCSIRTRCIFVELSEPTARNPVPPADSRIGTYK